MNIKAAFVILLGFSGIATAAGRVQEGFDRAAFYSVIQSGTLEQINSQMEIVKKSALPEKDAFEGTLLMKKAGEASGPKNKLTLFKAGHKKLEAAIQKDSTNTELRFLRLIIQEHAPGILGYKHEQEKDHDYIRKHFKNLLPVTRNAVIDYSKKSKVLKPSDF
jgi:hypothetical protein